MRWMFDSIWDKNNQRSVYIFTQLTNQNTIIILKYLEKNEMYGSIGFINEQCDKKT